MSSDPSGANSARENWVYGVASKGSFIKNPSVTASTWTIGVSGIPTNWIIYDSEDDYLMSEYLTLVSLKENNEISWWTTGSSLTKTISISTDNGLTWETKTSSTSGTLLATLQIGERILVKGTNTTYANASYYNYFSTTKDFYIKGNIMSLIYGDSFASQTTLSAERTFTSLFENCTHLISSEKLKMPATTLTNYCYKGMFHSCTAMTSPTPSLPATSLTSQCYYQMFIGCTALTTAPIISATTLATYCCVNMFSNCSSLVTAPILHATTLVNYCYQGMFYGCSSLNYIKAMFTTKPTTSYTKSWVYGVASSGTFVKNSAATWSVTGVNGIPSGWTVQTASS